MSDSTALSQYEREKKREEAFAPRMKQIVPGLFLGNVASSCTRDLLEANHISAVVSLTTSKCGFWGTTTKRIITAEAMAEGADTSIPRHKWVQCADSSTQDLLVHMSEICDFIDEMASPALKSLSSLPDNENGTADRPLDAPSEAVLIHCELGISRSPTIIIAYLMRKFRAQKDDVLKFVQSKQKVRPSMNFTRQLADWAEVEYSIWEDQNSKIPKAPYQAFLRDRAARLKEKGLTGDEPLAPLTL